MQAYTSFEQFAPTVLRAYHRDKEAFWAAAMAPFLADSPGLLQRWRDLRTGLQLASAFKGLDRDASQTLAEWSAPLASDVTQWRSNRPQYFKDAYPIFAFLAVWMDEVGLGDLLARFADILRAGVFAVAGYGILDVNVDGNKPSPVEVLTAQALIAEYETLALDIFGVTPVNLHILHRMRTLFLQAEIREKAARGKVSPYSLDRPEELGAKGANSVGPFMLSLERIGRAGQIEDYWRVFLLFGAAIQMMDDWQDLESDLAAGHYSYVTLGHEALLVKGKPKPIARQLRADHDHVKATCQRAQEMIDQSRAILARLDDPCLGRLVDVTEARLDSFYRKEMKVGGPHAA